MIVQYCSTQTNHQCFIYFLRTIKLLTLIPRYVICFWSSSQQKHSVPEFCHKDQFPLLLGNGKVCYPCFEDSRGFFLLLDFVEKPQPFLLDSKRRTRKISFISPFQYSIRAIFVHGVLILEVVTSKEYIISLHWLTSPHK